ncbi:FMN-binding protein MioC [Mergibacter septicus]|uniref:FMN-binding protein MioC n=1 Tax=Mergibacter septicus TaxID=221402 RepID=UPI001179168E|nr:FMN-binding protein MioC [Mergibacter septicus]AWX14076.1 FMN-binding protein MioC [Mergibacter septicus]
MNTAINIISGSTLGTAEYVAEHLKTLFQQQNIKTHLFHGPIDFKPLLQQKIWLFVTSTYGAGDLPENLHTIFQQLAEKKPDLTTIQYAIIGLGNSDYDTFCGAVDLIHQQMQSLGAKQICNNLKIDILEHLDPEQVAENWLPTFLQQLN